MSADYLESRTSGGHRPPPGVWTFLECRIRLKSNLRPGFHASLVTGNCAQNLSHALKVHSLILEPSSGKHVVAGFSPRYGAEVVATKRGLKPATTHSGVLVHSKAFRSIVSQSANVQTPSGGHRPPLQSNLYFCHRLLGVVAFYLHKAERRPSQAAAPN